MTERRPEIAIGAVRLTSLATLPVLAVTLALWLRTATRTRTDDEMVAAR